MTLFIVAGFIGFYITTRGREVGSSTPMRLGGAVPEAIWARRRRWRRGEIQMG